MLVMLDHCHAGHLEHVEALPFHRLDDVSAIVDAMGQARQSAPLCHPFWIVKVNDVLSRKVLNQLAVLVAERVAFRLARFVVDNAVADLAAIDLVSFGHVVRCCDSVAWDALVLRVSCLRFGQQDECLAVHVD